ncbi:MAG: PRC-barrel domain containing protein [Planctomycetota bacterium]|nr:MAG: PRC-barrel domain containing protein [Planctomycetota bacterium]REK39842.1 MAG: PRC-barrel domain containing protein [Planctomycetota bacterium]
MLIAASATFGSKVIGVDGQVGTLKDLSFHDPSWKIRYLVVDSGTWLPGRQVLLSPKDVADRDWNHHFVIVPHTQQAIEDSPPIYSDQPVSLEMEKELERYFNWHSPLMGNPAAGPVTVGSDVYLDAESEHPDPEKQNAVLRSAKEVISYSITAKDGGIGHVEDLIVDDEHWAIRYFIVDTRNWLPGKKVIVSPAWIDSIYWVEQAVHVNVDREAIKNSPEFDPSTPINREYEEHLYDYYGRDKYWS